jgi:hypothetical protein
MRESYILLSSSSEKLVEIIVLVFGVINLALSIVKISENLADVRFSVPRSSIISKFTLNKLLYKSLLEDLLENLCSYFVKL